MDKFFTYLEYKHHTKIINYLDKEIKSLDSLIELRSSLESDKVTY